MVGLDDGSKAIWQAVVADFLDLWEHGLVVDNNHYVVAIVRVVMDGMGLQDFTETHGNDTPIQCFSFSPMVGSTQMRVAISVFQIIGLLRRATGVLWISISALRTQQRLSS
jgi:hypothetical protein